MPNERKKRNASAPERRAARQAPARVAQAELVAHRAVDEELAQPVGEPRGGRDRLAILHQQLAPLGDAAEILVHAPLEPGGVGRLDLEVGQHVLPDARRREQRAGTQLAQVALHGLRAFRAVAGGAHHQAGREREHGVAHPAHRQVAQPVVARLDILDADEALGGRDHVAVAQEHALGTARRAGGVGDQRHVLGASLLELALVVVGMLAREAAARGLDLRERLEEAVAVAAHAARVLVDHQAEAGQVAAQREHLVDLLLVLGHHDRHLGVGEHVHELAGDGVLVERHRHAAQRLRGELRPVEAGAVVAEHGELVAALEAERRQAQREVAHVLLAVAPAVGLPDAAVLLAHAGPPGSAPGVAPQQLGQRVGVRIRGELHGRPFLLVPR